MKIQSVHFPKYCSQKLYFSQSNHQLRSFCWGVVWFWEHKFILRHIWSVHIYTEDHYPLLCWECQPLQSRHLSPICIVCAVVTRGLWKAGICPDTAVYDKSSKMSFFDEDKKKIQAKNPTASPLGLVRDKHAHFENLRYWMTVLAQLWRILQNWGLTHFFPCYKIISKLGSVWTSRLAFLSESSLILG